jgi:hypothetical protein
MDKYIEIISEPKFNDTIQIKLSEKETLSKWYRKLKSYDVRRLNNYKIHPIYSKIYTKKPRISKVVI